MNKRNKTYMVAIKKVVRRTILIPVTCYLETIAVSEAAALNEAKRINFNSKAWKDAFAHEEVLAMEFDSKEVSRTESKLKYVSAGRASQYHSDTNCEQCRKIRTQNE